MTMIYKNPTKKERAIKELKAEARARGENMTTFVPDKEKVQALYLKFGGLLVDENTEEGAEPAEKKPKRTRAPKA